MKLATCWWGIQILAQTEEEADVLRSLRAALPDHADEAHEHGMPSLVDWPEVSTFGDIDAEGLSREDLADGRMLLEIRR